MFTDEMLEFFVKESNIYYEKFLKEKFGDNYKEIILTKNSYNTYPYLYYKRYKERRYYCIYWNKNIYGLKQTSNNRMLLE